MFFFFFFFFNGRIWGDLKIIAILPSSLILLCWAEWGGVDIGIGNTGHVFYAILAFNNFVVFAPLKEILHEVAKRKLHKKHGPYIFAHLLYIGIQILCFWFQWDTRFFFFFFFSLLLVCVYLPGSINF